MEQVQRGSGTWFLGVFVFFNNLKTVSFTCCTLATLVTNTFKNKLCFAKLKQGETQAMSQWGQGLWNAVYSQNTVAACQDITPM